MVKTADYTNWQAPFLQVSLVKIAHSTTFCSGQYQCTAPLTAKQPCEQFYPRLRKNTHSITFCLRAKEYIASRSYQIINCMILDAERNEYNNE